MWPSYLLLRYASCLPQVGTPCGMPLVEQVPILTSLWNYARSNAHRFQGPIQRGVLVGLCPSWLTINCIAGTISPNIRDKRPLEKRKKHEQTIGNWSWFLFYCFLYQSCPITSVYWGKPVFTLDVCVCLCINVTIKFHIVSMGNIKNGFRPSLCVCVCVSIDAMLNFVVTANSNVKCEHSLTKQLS